MRILGAQHRRLLSMVRAHVALSTDKISGAHDALISIRTILQGNRKYFGRTWRHVDIIGPDAGPNYQFAFAVTQLFVKNTSLKPIEKVSVSLVHKKDSRPYIKVLKDDVHIGNIRFIDNGEQIVLTSNLLD